MLLNSETTLHSGSVVLLPSMVKGEDDRWSGQGWMSDDLSNPYPHCLSFCHSLASHKQGCSLCLYLRVTQACVTLGCCAPDAILALCFTQIHRPSSQTLLPSRACLASHGYFWIPARLPLDARALVHATCPSFAHLLDLCLLPVQSLLANHAMTHTAIARSALNCANRDHPPQASRER